MYIYIICNFSLGTTELMLRYVGMYVYLATVYSCNAYDVKMHVLTKFFSV